MEAKELQQKLIDLTGDKDIFVKTTNIDTDSDYLNSTRTAQWKWDCIKVSNQVFSIRHQLNDMLLQETVVKINNL